MQGENKNDMCILSFTWWLMITLMQTCLNHSAFQKWLIKTVKQNTAYLTKSSSIIMHHKVNASLLCLLYKRTHVPQWGSRLKSNREGSPRTLCPQRALYVQVRTYMLEWVIVPEQWCSSDVCRLKCHASWVIRTPDPLTALILLYCLHASLLAPLTPYLHACTHVYFHSYFSVW